MSGWSELSRDALLYVRPAGLVSAAHAGPASKNAEVLAGGWRAFTSVEIIASEGGERIRRGLVPVGDLTTVEEELQGDHKTRFQAIMANLRSPRAPLEVKDWGPLPAIRPMIMGVINVTPDSFSDGGKFADTDAAIAHGLALAGAGADILDVGGESTRPGADHVWEGEEKQRVLPVIEGLLAGKKLISIDTRRASVMSEALGAGARIINDVSALREDLDAMGVAAETGAPVILMHAKGDPKTMQDDPQYDDVLLEVYDFLEDRIEACEQAGIPRERVMVDPGIGFGKAVRHNLELLNGLSIFHGLGCRIVLGASRKRFIAALSGVDAEEERVPGSLAAALAAVDQGVQIVRVHDVADTRQALDVWQGLSDASYLVPGATGL